MNFLMPGMFLLALLGIPIFLLYMLRLRRRDQVVSSTLLWQQIVKDQQANAPWQRLKYNLLMLIQLLILAALVLAMARPAVPTPTQVTGPTVILLDASASMLASDVSPNRFEAARATARTLVDQSAANVPISIIIAGVQPHLLVSNEVNHNLVKEALDTAQAEQGNSDWKTAFTLALGAASKMTQLGGETTTTIIISDGGIPSSGLPELAGQVRYLPVGKSGENLAISALAVRPAANGNQLFANVHNYGSETRRAVLSTYADEQLLDSQQIELGAGKDQRVILSNLPNGPHTYTTRLASPQGAATPLDIFSLDDTAYTVYQPTSGGRVLLLSKGNVFLRQLLENLPGVQPYLILEQEGQPLQSPAEAYDVYVLDGIVPQNLPAGNILILNPPDNDYFQVQGDFSDTGNVQLADNSINRFVDWSNVHVLKAKKVTLPDWGQPLIQSSGGPLVFVGESQGRRMAVVTFDLHGSDLPLQVTYPILFSNLLQYLSRTPHLTAVSSASNHLQDNSANSVKENNLQLFPGDAIQINPQGDSGEQAVLTAPDGKTEAVSLKEGKAIFDKTQKTGVYSVSYPQHPEISKDRFSVNLFSAAESALTPQKNLQIGHKQVVSQAETVMTQQEFWPWPVGLALILLTLEWVLFHRLQTFPLKPRGKKQELAK
jgi:Ca-activated chloride channel homolog